MIHIRGITSEFHFYKKQNVTPFIARIINHDDY